VAQRVNIVLVDDLDGKDADETVTFGLDGVTYEIDLTSANAAKLRDVLAPYVGHARKSGGASRRSSGRRSSSRRGAGSTSGPSAREVREWARANGYNLSDRGRVSSEVRAAYDAAN
jgi:hypothetical protein